jgi:Flp pilus assembly protein TadG
MTKKLTRICRRFGRSTDGLAAVEFAMIMPILLLRFLATIDAGTVIAIYMKERSATYSLDAITNQYTSVQTTDLQSITGATSLILSPYSSAPLVGTVSQIYINSKGNATVSWSYSPTGSARAVGSSVSVPTAMATPSSNLILGELKYTYTPMFGAFLTGPIALADSLFVTPRSSACVLYPQANVTTCPSG